MSSTQVAIIDYGMGNLHSVASAVRHVAPRADVIVTSDSQAIAQADRVIFPGVGAIRDCVAEIKHRGFDKAVAREMASGKPVLAICVGLQALMQSSEENGGVECLSAFEGEVKGFASTPGFNLICDESSHSGERLKVPHMGWNQVQQKQAHPLWHDIDDEGRFYFVHSYYVQTPQSDLVVGQSHYGHNFVAAIAQNNVFAAQFHPEKSHTNGLQLLKNFAEWDGKF
ncbi:imidazole glycerol phosphate synthase subunit HisH [Marinagarivorans algicola]|uniref:imidazole glycerol phosphate synthase subunit HisH n=1 Tax=Marinagarivorans algicola TaxID=1513270 RepID=UPI0006B44B65|nr:imidazole glycerol phosphate synthase subunit HisH [Marinagarivorans algicola]